jgi:thymidylate kinase
MNWILLGPDGGGKSTLAEALSKKFGFPVIHFTHRDATDDQLMTYLKVARNNNNVIYDRFIHDSWVYGPIFGGQSVATMEEIQIVENELKQKGAILVYCYAPLPQLVARMRERKEDGDFVTSKDVNRIKRVIKRYEELLEKTTLDVVRYDSSKTEVAQFLK